MDQRFSAAATLVDVTEPRGSALSGDERNLIDDNDDSVRRQFTEKEPPPTGQGSDPMMHLLATLGKDNKSRDSTREIPFLTLSSPKRDFLLRATFFMRMLVAAQENAKVYNDSTRYIHILQLRESEKISHGAISGVTFDGLLLDLFSYVYIKLDLSLYKLLNRLLEMKTASKDTASSDDEIGLRVLPEFHFTLPRKGWKNFAPISYYFTCDKRFVIHVEGMAQNRSLEELNVIARAYMMEHFPDYICEIVPKGFGATACASTEDNILTISRTILDTLISESQLIGVHLQSASTIYWISTAHGLEKVLANSPAPISQLPETLQADPVSCARCLPPNVSLSVGGAAVIASVCKSFHYFPALRTPTLGLSPSIDIMLGPAPVLVSDVTGELGQERITRMTVAGYLRPGGGRHVEYHITGVCGHSAVSNLDRNASQMLVYSTLTPGQPMTEAKVVTELGDGGQILIKNLPYEAYGSGLLVIEPSREGQLERGHCGHVEPKVGHSGSVWCILDNSGEEPTCKVFAITVAIADDFRGKGRKVWLISDLQVSLNAIVRDYTDHFSHSGRDFRCITRRTSNVTGRFVSPRPARF